MALSKKISLIVIILGIVFLFGFKGVDPAKAADVPKPETYFCKSDAKKGTPPSNVKVRITKVSLSEKNDAGWYSATITWQLSGTDSFNASNKFYGKYNYEPGNITRNTGEETSGAIGVGHGIYTVKDAIQLKPDSTLTYKFEKFKICWQEKITVTGGWSAPVDFYAEIQSTPVAVKIGSDGKAGEAVGEDGNPIDGSTPAGSTDGGVSGYQACIEDLGKDCSTDECCGSLKGFAGTPTMVYVQCWALCSLDQAVTRFLTFAFEAIINDALGI